MSSNEYVVVLNQSQLGRTNNFDDANPNWVSILGVLTGTLYNIKQVPYSYAAWITTSDGIWHTPDVRPDPPVWTCIMTLAAMRAACGNVAARFGSLDISSHGTVYFAQHRGGGESMANWGHFAGDVGGFVYVPWPIGAGFGTFTTSNFSVDAITDLLADFGCGTGGGGGARVYASDGSLFLYPAEFGYICAVSEGFVISANGNLCGPGLSPAVYDVAVLRNYTFGLDTLNGAVPLADGGVQYRFLYRDLVSIASAVAVFGGAPAGPIGGRAIYRDTNQDHIIWVEAAAQAVGVPPRVIVYSDDGFASFDDKTGDWVAVIGAWAGGSGTSQADGNALAIVVNPVRTFPNMVRMADSGAGGTFPNGVRMADAVAGGTFVSGVRFIDA